MAPGSSNLNNAITNRLNLLNLKLQGKEYIVCYYLLLENSIKAFHNKLPISIPE